jgi:hypothetical protein
LATLDVENFFYDVTPTVVARVLAPVRGPGQTKSFLIDWLSRTSAASGSGGLPVGHQPSSVLGNYLLVPADPAVNAANAWLRYMDDTWTFIEREDHADAIYGAYSQSLAHLRLRVNDSKFKVYDTIEAQEVVRSSLNDYLDSSLHDPDVGSEDARALFEFAIENPYGQRRELRRALTVLRKRQDTYAVPLLQQAPGLLGPAPEHWDRYLRTVVAGAGRNALDLDWVAEGLVAPRSGHPDVERLVFLRVLAAGQPSKARGRELADMAVDARMPAPVRVAAAAAWGRSKGSKRDRAVDAALAAPDFPTRRAFAATLKQRPVMRAFARHSIDFDPLTPSSNQRFVGSPRSRAPRARLPQTASAGLRCVRSKRQAPPVLVQGHTPSWGSSTSSGSWPGPSTR